MLILKYKIQTASKKRINTLTHQSQYLILTSLNSNTEFRSSTHLYHYGVVCPKHLNSQGMPTYICCIIIFIKQTKMKTIQLQNEKATKINLLDFKSVQMRTFHLSWIAFFLCFFGWFAHAPLMKSTIAPDLDLTKAQTTLAFIASVGVTIFARLGIGNLCDKIGPRKSYVYLLIFGAIAVASSSFAYSWETYLLSRLAIGVIGASFVVTQYHTSVMFAPNVIGIANATTAGWGNLGGGVTNAAMPLIASAVAAFGLAEATASWRIAMYVPALIMLFVAYLYWKYTTDCPKGNYTDIPKDVMQGYTVMVDEALKQMDTVPTHVFLQGGVGGFPAAVVSFLVESLPLNSSSVSKNASLSIRFCFWNCVSFSIALALPLSLKNLYLPLSLPELILLSLPLSTSRSTI